MPPFTSVRAALAWLNIIAPTYERLMVEEVRAREYREAVNERAYREMTKELAAIKPAPLLKPKETKAQTRERLHAMALESIRTAHIRDTQPDVHTSSRSPAPAPVVDILL